MRRLLLLRHAKAERAEPSERDFDRRLAARGREDASLVGAYLARHGFVPDRIVVSPAARTRETWDLVAAALPKPPKAKFEERIYDASPEALLAIARETKPEVQTLFMIGHNPGFHELAVTLVATGDIEARQRLNEGMPTCGLAIVEFALDRWDRLHPQSGRLSHFLTRHSIGASTD